jgi:membrane-bound serine protease (ClpP class)
MFQGKNNMHNSLVIPVFLQLLGTGVVIAEFFIPSGGILSILAAGLFGYSLYDVFAHVSTNAGIVFVVIDVIFIPVLVLIGIRTIARSPAALKTTLSQAEGVTSQASDLQEFLGKEGSAVTPLHPAGIAFIEGKRVDVVTSGEYIGKLSAIKVVAVTGNQVVVKKKNS